MGYVPATTERVEVVTPQLTSSDLVLGRGDDAGLEGVGPSSFEKAIQQIARWLKISGTNTGKVRKLIRKATTENGKGNAN
eukprot:scaffold97763_cov48-Prasinocladus_malaysianus.AAC.2